MDFLSGLVQSYQRRDQKELKRGVNIFQANRINLDFQVSVTLVQFPSYVLRPYL